MKNLIRTLLKRLLKEEQGSTLVMVALGMVALMGATAMVTDVGLIYLEKTKLTNALDAAVLAGAQELPGQPAKARDVAVEYATLNGVDPSQLKVTVSPDNQSMSVEAKRNVNMFFARVLGFNSKEVSALAKASVGSINGMVGVIPLALEEQPLVFGKEYTLKTGDGKRGWFGPVALGGNGANVYRTNLENGYSSYLKMGDTIDTEPGNMTGPTVQGLEYRINQDPHYPKCTPASYQRSCPRVVYIPIVSSPTKGGRSTVTVKGFAAFLLTEAEEEDCNDHDKDGITNDKDNDDDNDGINDAEDADDDNDGFEDSKEDNDHDNDGINNDDDNDDDNDGINDDEDEDDDNDGINDAEDEDDDNDGIHDDEDEDDCDSADNHGNGQSDDDIKSVVRGYFLEEIAPGDIDTAAKGYGLNGVKLVE